MAGPQTREKLSQIGDPDNPRDIRARSNFFMRMNPDLGRGKRYEPTGIPYDPPKGEPWGPDLTQDPSNAWQLMGSKANIPWQNSGVMLAMANSPAINKMKNIYSQFDPFFPNVDLDDQRVGYDFNKNLWGGTLGFGGGYGTEDDAYNAYINWGTNW